MWVNKLLKLLEVYLVPKIQKKIFLILNQNNKIKKMRIKAKIYSHLNKLHHFHYNKILLI